MWFCKLFYSLGRNISCLRDELNISTPFCTNCVYEVFCKVISARNVVLQTVFSLGRKKGCLRDELNISTPFCTNCVYEVFLQSYFCTLCDFANCF